jgi:acetyl-CoA carboxylase biotin carboxyl carrier protein
MATTINAPITGTVWKILVKVGDTVTEGQEVMILESMKMEIPVEAPEDGVIAEIKTAEAAVINEDDVLMVLS